MGDGSEWVASADREESESQDDEGSNRPRSKMSAQSKKGGCAHCSVGDSTESAASSLGLMLMLGLLVLRLRRRGS